MTFTVLGLQALEVLDSRGRPTVRAFCCIDGVKAWATTPSGASTGSHEAWERRDNDPARYAGWGCQQAVSAVNDEIAELVVGRSFVDQREFDEAICHLDGTPNLERLGANATLATSLATAVAVAGAQRMELHDYFASLPRLEHAQPQQSQPKQSQPQHAQPKQPRPMVNLFSGGRHAGGQVAVQDLLIVSMADEIGGQLHQIERVYAAATQLVSQKYGMRELTADEGGLAPDFEKCEDLFLDAAGAVEAAGLSLGSDITFAVDVAASEFFTADRYHIDGQHLSGDELSAVISRWCDRYPIVSIEDGLAEDDWPGWTKLRTRLPADVVVIGDDLLCTNVNRVNRAAMEKAANGLLLKVNQAGTLSLAVDALDAARQAGWSITVSARSGETEDRWLADAAVGWEADFIKVGSVRQSERLAKYNRLLEIAAGITTYV